MKSIGLFGDSYTGTVHFPGYQTHWSTLLQIELGAAVTNYGEPGSSLYFSYKKND